METDFSVPIFWTAAANLMININHMVWISTNPATGDAVIRLSVELPDGSMQLKIAKGRQLSELIAMLGTRTDRRGML
jgi:hypothetical protein